MENILINQNLEIIKTIIMAYNKKNLKKVIFMKV